MLLESLVLPASPPRDGAAAFCRAWPQTQRTRWHILLARVFMAPGSSWLGPWRLRQVLVCEKPPETSSGVTPKKGDAFVPRSFVLDLMARGKETARGVLAPHSPFGLSLQEVKSYLLTPSPANEGVSWGPSPSDEAVEAGGCHRGSSCSTNIVAGSLLKNHILFWFKAGMSLPQCRVNGNGHPGEVWAFSPSFSIPGRSWEVGFGPKLICKSKISLTPEQ